MQSVNLENSKLFVRIALYTSVSAVQLGLLVGEGIASMYHNMLTRSLLLPAVYYRPSP